eukprot:scaffold71462_cov64-Phaeocystis_antarctica.AAC.1
MLVSYHPQCPTELLSVSAASPSIANLDSRRGGRVRTHAVCAPLVLPQCLGKRRDERAARAVARAGARVAAAPAHSLLPDEHGHAAPQISAF